MKREEYGALVAELMPMLLEQLKAQSQGVGEIEVVDTLDGISSLPALKIVGGVERVVEAPLMLLAAGADQVFADCRKVVEQAAAAAASMDTLVANPPKIIDGVWHVYVSAANDYQSTGVAAQGVKGDKGDKGDVGETGAKGDTGDKGDQGDQGATGATGSKGTKGDKGDKGDVGETGAKGDKGDTGAKGDKGEGLDINTMTPEQITNIKGEKGDQGVAGAAGAKGDKGDQGVAGAAGAKGDKGDPGVAGAAGAKGDKGDPGAAGAKGDKGDTGAAGTDGAPGKDGIDGKDGAPGKDGQGGKSARNLIARKYLIELNNPYSTIFNFEGDNYNGYGESLGLQPSVLLQQALGGALGLDIFRDKIAYKPTTQYAFSIRWRQVAVAPNDGLSFDFYYSDGTKQSVTMAKTQITPTTSSLITTAGKSLTKISCSYKSDMYTYIYQIQMTEGTEVVDWIEAAEDREISFSEDTEHVIFGQKWFSKDMSTMKQLYSKTYRGQLAESFEPSSYWAVYIDSIESYSGIVASSESVRPFQDAARVEVNASSQNLNISAREERFIGAEYLVRVVYTKF